MTNNTADAASVKKRVWLTVGGLVAAAGITVGVLGMAGGGDQQDRALVHTDQDSSPTERGARTRSNKVAPASSSADSSSSTATAAATDASAVDSATTGDTATAQASVGATPASAPGGKASAASSGATATGAAAGSSTGGSTSAGAAGSGTTGAGSAGNGGASGGTTGGAAIVPPVTQAPAPPPPPPTPAAQCTAGGANANAAAVAQRFCDHRASRGLAVMSRSSRLDAAAQNRAQQMANAGVLDHSDYEDLVWGACADCTGVGENLANFSTVGDAWSFWIGSSMHSANLNHPGGGEFGVGAVTAANGTIFFVHLFGWY